MFGSGYFTIVKCWLENPNAVAKIVGNEPEIIRKNETLIQKPKTSLTFPIQRNLKERWFADSNESYLWFQP